MKTGFYIRHKRNGKWGNVDIADLTNEEFRQFLQSHTAIEALNWALALQQWIVENVIFEKEEKHEMEVDS